MSCINCMKLENPRKDKCICNSENRCKLCKNCRWCINKKKEGNCVPHYKYTKDNCINFIDYKRPDTKNIKEIDYENEYSYYVTKSNSNNNLQLINIIIFILMLCILFLALHYQLN